jgi:hypothetical protein
VLDDLSRIDISQRLTRQAAALFLLVDPGGQSACFMIQPRERSSREAN